MEPSDVCLANVTAAHRRLRPILKPTPVVYSEMRHAHLKLENLQVTGAYKVRGALNALAVQIERGDRRPVVAASAGNHAKGVAWAARHFNLPACLVLPRTAPRTKLDGTAGLGAEVIVHGDSFEEASLHARRLADDNGWRFLPAFDDVDVIAGQGTVAVELLELEPDVVLVPIGGGGLAAGMGVVLKAHGVRVVGVQVEGVDAMTHALRGTAPLGEPRKTIADGLRVSAPGTLTTPICRTVLDDVVTVTEDEVRACLVGLAGFERVIAEGAGAVAPAALDKVSGKRRFAVVSGGNIDMDVLLSLLGPARKSASADRVYDSALQKTARTQETERKE